MIKVKETGDVVGDVDLFFSPEGEAEVNIMIASPDNRRRGYAGEALMLLLQYGKITGADVVSVNPLTHVTHQPYKDATSGNL